MPVWGYVFICTSYWKIIHGIGMTPIFWCTSSCVFECASKHARKRSECFDGGDVISSLKTSISSSIVLNSFKKRYKTCSGKNGISFTIAPLTQHYFKPFACPRWGQPNIICRMCRRASTFQVPSIILIYNTTIAAFRKTESWNGGRKPKDHLV